MKKKLLFGVIAAVLIIAVILIYGREYRQARRECDRLRANVEVLTDSAKMYKTDAGDNAIRVGVLRMQLDEYKKMRAGDLAKIKQMGIKQKDLERVARMQHNTIINMRGVVHDSIIYRDNNIVDTLRCVDIRDKWYTMSGCVDASGEFNGTYESRDSIIVVETIKYKRFLGFLWRTKKIKSRALDIVNANPHTTITGAEHIIIEK